MKKMKLSAKAVLSLVLSAVLFCMPGLGFAMNGNYTVSVHAEDTEPESSSEENRTENDTEQETESGSEENSTEEDTVSGGDVKEPECTCEDKCGAYEYDHNCEVCVKDYKLCAYKKPNVTIQINQPDGWHNDKATVTFCYPAPLVLQIILISVKLNEGTDSDILMFFTAECLNRYLLVLSYQSYKNSRYLPDQSLTPAIITIRCTTTSLNREMLHQRYDNNYSTF